MCLWELRYWFSYLLDQALTLTINFSQCHLLDFQIRPCGTIWTCRRHFFPPFYNFYMVLHDWGKNVPKCHCFHIVIIFRNGFTDGACLKRGRILCEHVQTPYVESPSFLSLEKRLLLKKYSYAFYASCREESFLISLFWLLRWLFLVVKQTNSGIINYTKNWLYLRGILFI